MSSSRMSKADREIVAQGQGSDIDERTKSFKAGSKSPNKKGKEKGQKFGQDFDRDTENLEENEDEEEEQDEESGNDLPGADWDRMIPNEDVGTKVKLRWSGFDWKPHRSTFLKGTSNWIGYKEALLTQLCGIGYTPGIKLTPLDEVRLAGLVQSTTTPEAQILIRGVSEGSKMMRAFESTYQQLGMVQQENSYEKLSSLRYKGGCPIRYVTEFKSCVTSFLAVGGKMPKSQLKIIFKNSVKEKARSWHSMISSMPLFQNWTIDQIYQNFISSLYHRVQKDIAERGEGGRSSGRSIYNVQSREDAESNRDSRKKNIKGGFKKNVKCWNCKQTGNYSTKCPKEKRESDTRSKTKDIGPPPGLGNEYFIAEESGISGTGFSAQVNQNFYNQLISFYENEIAKRSTLITTVSNELLSPSARINVAQKILSTHNINKGADRWLFDTGADVDATNSRKNFVPGTVVELNPKQFSVQTGGGVIFGSCMGQVRLNLTGPESKKSVLTLK